MNSITISGRLGRDPEQDVVGDGKERVRFTVAVNRFAKKGETAVTDWFDCVAFGKTGTAIKTYIHKGDQIILRGAMQSYKGTKDPSKTYWSILVDEFDFGSKKGEKSEQTAAASSAPGFEDGSDIPF